MPVKIFTAGADEVASLEAKINDWLAKLEPGSVRQVTTTTAQAPALQIVITVWYTEGTDRN
jgi:hypothetical protein